MLQDVCEGRCARRSVGDSEVFVEGNAGQEERDVMELSGSGRIRFWWEGQRAVARDVERDV